jgi:hypothetical protein
MFKKIVIALCTLLLVAPLMAQTGAKAVESRFIAAIKAADTETMSVLFFSSVDLTLPEDEGTYSKKQASMILRNFFENNPPKAFDVKQSGTSNDGSRFTIGNYTSNNGSVYRILFLVKKIGNEYKVHLMEIEEEL